MSVLRLLHMKFGEFYSSWSYGFFGYRNPLIAVNVFRHCIAFNTDSQLVFLLAIIHRWSATILTHRRCLSSTWLIAHVDCIRPISQVDHIHSQWLPFTREPADCRVWWLISCLSLTYILLSEVPNWQTTLELWHRVVIKEGSPGFINNLSGFISTNYFTAKFNDCDRFALASDLRREFFDDFIKV